MSGNERTGRRDLLYSRWHRVENVSRFLTRVQANQLEMIDLDDIESCPTCHRTLVNIETKNSAHDPASFPTYILATHAIEAGMCAYCVCYTCICGVAGEVHETKSSCDIAEFRVRQIAPLGGTKTVDMTPAEYAQWLYAFRVEHWRFMCASPPQQYR